MVSSNLVDWQRVTFDEAFTDITAKASKVDQSEFLHSGKYPIVDQGQNFIAGYTDNEDLVWGEDLPVVIFADHTRILKYVDFPFVLGADGTKVLKPNKDILPLFAYYQLLNFDIPSAGYSRHFKFLKDFSFQYPPLTEQKRIASLLARADRLRQLRRTAHELGESLLQSVFLEMFGDVEKNPKKLPEATLEHIASKAKFGIVDGPFGSHLKAEEYTNSGVRVIRVNNIKPNRFNFDDVRFVSQEKYETIKRSTVRPNDIVMAKVGNTIGKTCVFPSEIEYAVLTANVCKITVDAKHANPVFISYQMNFDVIQERIRNLSGDTAKPMINIPRLKELKLLLPPLSKQEEFAGVVARVESLRGRMSEGERQVEGLFESLLAESFGGG